MYAMMTGGVDGALSRQEAIDIARWKSHIGAFVSSIWLRKVVDTHMWDWERAWLFDGQKQNKQTWINMGGRNYYLGMIGCQPVPSSMIKMTQVNVYDELVNRWSECL